MVDYPFPDDVTAFLLTHIDSIAQLEALLLLRADPRREWNAEALAKRLYISPRETAAVLDRLCADGFVALSDQVLHVYQYHPRSNELGQMVDQVAELYARYLIPVTQLIHSKPRTRIQEFADAFKLRKTEQDGKRHL
jgi:hypothetical protein